MTEKTLSENCSNTLKQKIYFHGWQVKFVKITSVGVGIQIIPQRPSRFSVVELGDFLALLKEIALESDLLMPLIVALQVQENEPKDIGLLTELRRQQVFHRGKFLLLPIASGRTETEINQVRQNLCNLLSPEAEDINDFEPPQTLELAEFWDRLHAEPTLAGDPIDRLSGWRSVTQPGAIFSPKEQKEYWVRVWEKLLKNEVVQQPGQGRQGEGRPGRVVEKPESLCTRITTARIRDFKGLKDTGCIDLDADIVLLTGANGNGKSSFVEALSFGLTGYHPDWEPPHSTDHFFFSGNRSRGKAQEFRIELETEHHTLESDGGGGAVTRKTLCFTRQPGRDGGKDDHLDILRREIGSEGEAAGKEMYVPVDRQLHFRMTSYLPEHVNMLFEENVAPAGKADQEDDEDLSRCLEPADRVNLLRHLFPALAPEIEALCVVTEKRLSEIDNELDSIRTRIEGVEDFAERLEGFSEFFSSLQKLIQQLPIPGARDWTINSGWDEQPEDVHAYCALLDAERESLEKLFSGSLAEFWLSLPDLVERTGSVMPGAAQRQKEIHAVELEISQIKQKIRELEAKLEQPEVSSEILTKFRDYCRFFLDNHHELIRELNSLMAEESGAGVDLAREMERVDPDRMRLAEQELTGLLGKYRDTLQRELMQNQELLARQEERRSKLSQQYEDTESFKRLAKFFDTSDRRDLLRSLENDHNNCRDYDDLIENRDKLTRERNSFARLSDFIEQQRWAAAGEAGDDEDLHKSSRPNRSLRKAVEDVLNQVLQRFVLAGGMEQVQVTEEYELKADTDKQDEPDKQRGLACFSSGQKAQIGMAWMVAVRELMQSEKNREVIHFPHRILIMDDPSTTFDTTNLLSQAVLWRQLAYNRDPSRRYQVFIVSHHEEFSSHLLDLLCPPPGYSMRLVRFEDWDPENGAKIKTYDVEPSPADLRHPCSSEDNGEDALSIAKKAFEDGLARVTEMI